MLDQKWLLWATYSKLSPAREVSEVQLSLEGIKKVLCLSPGLCCRFEGKNRPEVKSE